MDCAGTDPLDARLGRALRARQRACGLTQAQLGEAVQVSAQLVHKYEVGATRVSVSRLVRIAGSLGCSAAALVAEVERSRMASGPESREG